MTTPHTLVINFFTIRIDHICLEDWPIVADVGTRIQSGIELAKPCSPSGLTGIRTLEAIRHGKLPPGLQEWPLSEDDDGSSGGESRILLLMLLCVVTF